jgi:hypothetical protein
MSNHATAAATTVLWVRPENNDSAVPKRVMASGLHTRSSVSKIRIAIFGTVNRQVFLPSTLLDGVHYHSI